jgi:hypothetical protein
MFYWKKSQPVAKPGHRIYKPQRQGGPPIPLGNEQFWTQGAPTSNPKPLRGYQWPRFIQPASYATFHILISHTTGVIISSKSKKYTPHAPLQHNTRPICRSGREGKGDIPNNGIKKYIPRFWECSGSQPPKWSVCVSPSFVSWVVKCHFVVIFFTTAWEGNELLSRSAAFVFRRVLPFKTRKQNTRKRSRIKTIKTDSSKLNLSLQLMGTSHLRFRQTQKNGRNNKNVTHVCSAYNRRALEIQHKSPPQNVWNSTRCYKINMRKWSGQTFSSVRLIKMLNYSNLQVFL